MTIGYTLHHVELRLRTNTPEDSPCQLHRLTNPIDASITVHGAQLPNSNENPMYTIEIGLEKLMDNKWIECNPNPTKGNEIRPLFKDFNVQMCIGQQKQRTIIPSNVAPQDGHFLYYQIPNFTQATFLTFQVVMKMNTSKEKQGYKRGQDAIFRFAFRLMKHTFNENHHPNITCVAEDRSFHFGIINHGKTNKAARMYAGKKEGPIDQSQTSPRKSPSPSPNPSSPYQSPVYQSPPSSVSPQPSTYLQPPQQQYGSHSPQPHSPYHSPVYHSPQPVQQSPVQNQIWNFDQKQFLAYIQNNPQFRQQLMELAAQKRDYQDLAESLKLLSVFNQQTNPPHSQPNFQQQYHPHQQQQQQYQPYYQPSSNERESPSSIISSSTSDDDILSSDFLDDFDPDLVQDIEPNDLLLDDSDDIIMLDDNEFQFEDVDINEYFNQPVHHQVPPQNGFLGLLVDGPQQQQFNTNNQFYQVPQQQGYGFLQPQHVTIDRARDRSTMAMSPYEKDNFDTSQFFATSPDKQRTTETGEIKGRTIEAFHFNPSHPSDSQTTYGDMSQYNFGAKPAVSVHKSYEKARVKSEAVHLNKKKVQRRSEEEKRESRSSSTMAPRQAARPQQSLAMGSAQLYQANPPPSLYSIPSSIPSYTVTTTTTTRTESATWPMERHELYAYDDDDEAEESDELNRAMFDLSITDTKQQQQQQPQQQQQQKLVRFIVSSGSGSKSGRYVHKGKKNIPVFEIGDRIEFNVKPSGGDLKAMLHIANFPGKSIIDFDNKSQNKLFTPIPDKGLTAHLDTKALKNPTSKRLLAVTLYVRMGTGKAAIIPKSILLVPKGTLVQQQQQSK
jgi:hypothetical protein